MKTFSMFFSEDAGDKFNQMDDSQFDDWKKKNPGAADKADELRKKARMKKDSSAIVKPGAPTPASKTLPGQKGLKGEVQKKLTDTAKKLASDQARKLAGTVKGKVKQTIADKIRKREAGKWSQGIKNAPKQDEPDMPGLDDLLGDIRKEGEQEKKKSSAIVPSTQKMKSGSAGEPELEGQKAKDAKAKEERGQYRKMKDAVSGGMRDYDKEKEAAKKAKEEEEKNKGVGDHLKDRWNNSIFRNKKKQADAIYDAPGKLAAFLARQARSSVGRGGDVAFGQDMSGLRQR